MHARDGTGAAGEDHSRDSEDDADTADLGGGRATLLKSFKSEDRSTFRK